MTYDWRKYESSNLKYTIGNFNLIISYLIINPVSVKLMPSYLPSTKTGKNDATINVIEDVSAIANNKVNIILVLILLSSTDVLDSMAVLFENLIIEKFLDSKLKVRKVLTICVFDMLKDDNENQ